MAAPASRCGHARCRARGALIPHSALPSLCACPYRKTGSHFPGHAPAQAWPRRRPPCAPADYTESLVRGRGRRARSPARHEECRRLLPVRNSADGRHSLGREARITLRERSRHWQPNGHGSAGQAETTGRGSGLAERASGLAERASGLTPRTAADRPWRRPGRSASGVIARTTSPSPRRRDRACCQGRHPPLPAGPHPH